MEQFASWEMLATFATLVTVVFTVVEFTKELPYVKAIPTKYYTWAIAFLLILLGNVYGGTFKVWDVLMYAISAIFVSLSGNGLSEFNKK